METMATVIRRLQGVGRAYTDVARSPGYFPLWLSQLISNFGDTLHYIALVVLVFQLTGQGLAIAALLPPRSFPRSCSARSPASSSTASTASMS